MKVKENVYRRLVSYLRPYWRQMMVAYAGMFATLAFRLWVPQIIKTAIDDGISAGISRPLFLAGGLILLLAILRMVSAFCELFFSEWLTYRVAYDLRNQFYDRVQKLPFTFHDQAHTGDLMSRATSDISETERFVGIGLMGLTSTTLMVLGVIIAMLIENWRLSLFALIPIPVLMFASIKFRRRIHLLFKRVQEQMGTVSKTMQESMTGIRVVKAFAREPYEHEKFDAENEGYFNLRYELIRRWADSWPLFEFLVAICVIVLLWVGGPVALRGEITIGSLFALISYVMMLNFPVQRLGFLVSLAATAGASAGRVFEIMDTPNEVADRPNGLDLSNIEGDVTFKDVSFAYANGRPILHDISFVAEAGQTVALVGATGSGKSTVTNLIPRFYEQNAGIIQVDGYDIRQLTAQSLRQHIGIVLQDPFLFSQTIGENIAYGCPTATHEQIVSAAKSARAHEFIMSFPDGYDTRVGERGVTVSGGQKQRIAIARALLADPRILILDDSTSSVDTETEHLIQQALQTLMEGRTTFVIAQRLLTLKQADQILVLENGEIIERGTHDQLLALDGAYRQIYDLQLRDQEEFVALQMKMPAFNDQEAVFSD